jgi:hypothetical protein
MANDSARRATGLRPFFNIEPDNCAGRTTLDRASHVVVPVVVYDWQIVDHCNQIAWRVDGAFATGVTSHFTILDNRISLFEILARNPKPVTHRMQREQIFGAGIDAVPAGRACILDDDRQVVLTHDDRIDVTYDLAVA